jgi:hypothetical protein
MHTCRGTYYLFSLFKLHTHTHTHTYIYIQAGIVGLITLQSKCAIPTYVHTCIAYAHIHTYIYTYIYICTYTYLYIYIHICIYNPGYATSFGCMFVPMYLRSQHTQTSRAHTVFRWNGNRSDLLWSFRAGLSFASELAVHG